MPNGGSDCCGTCWFNQKNQGEVGYSHSRDQGQDYCVVRAVEIENPFWTYCTNHPHHNPAKIASPIGPLYVCAKDSYGREISQPSPDTEEIRQMLLKLLDGIEEQPKDEYPAGLTLNEMVVWQLGEFREPRAVAGIERVSRFDPAKSTGTRLNESNERLVKLADEALVKIKE